MPGPPRWRTPVLVAHSLSAGKLAFTTLTARARSVLALVQRCARAAPDVIWGTGEERTRDDPVGRTFVRRVASEGMVLLKNESNILPIQGSADPGRRTKVAVIGPNAKGYVISGGGSAALKPSYVVTPWDGLFTGAPKGVDLSYHVGCYGPCSVNVMETTDSDFSHLPAHKFLPSLEPFITSPTGASGWLITFHTHPPTALTPFAPPEALAATESGRYELRDTRMKLNDFTPPGIGTEWTAYMRATLGPDESGRFELGLAVAGRARCYVDGVCVLQNWDVQTRGEFIYGYANFA